jgi:hypothetical protein
MANDPDITVQKSLALTSAKYDSFLEYFETQFHGNLMSQDPLSQDPLSQENFHDEKVSSNQEQIETDEFSAQDPPSLITHTTPRRDQPRSNVSKDASKPAVSSHVSKYDILKMSQKLETKDETNTFSDDKGPVGTGLDVTVKDPSGLKFPMFQPLGNCMTPTKVPLTQNVGFENYKIFDSLQKEKRFIQDQRADDQKMEALLLFTPTCEQAYFQTSSKLHQRRENQCMSKDYRSMEQFKRVHAKQFLKDKKTNPRKSLSLEYTTGDPSPNVSTKTTKSDVSTDVPRFDVPNDVSSFGVPTNVSCSMKNVSKFLKHETKVETKSIDDFGFGNYNTVVPKDLPSFECEVPKTDDSTYVSSSMKNVSKLLKHETKVEQKSNDDFGFEKKRRSLQSRKVTNNMEQLKKIHEKQYFKNDQTPLISHEGQVGKMLITPVCVNKPVCLQLPNFDNKHHRRGIFLGFSSKGYNIKDIDTGKVIESTNVAFVEDYC